MKPHCFQLTLYLDSTKIKYWQMFLSNRRHVVFDSTGNYGSEKLVVPSPWDHKAKTVRQAISPFAQN